MVANMDEPPTEKNGKGLPVMGNSEMAQPMFKNAWKTSMDVRQAERPRVKEVRQF